MQLQKEDAQDRVQAKKNGVSPLPADHGSAERRKLPRRGPGLSPSQKRILVQFELKKTHLMLRNYFYRAMHYSAKRGLAITCRLSVRPSVRLSMRLRFEHVARPCCAL